MLLTDSHTHLFLEQFDEDIHEVVKRANDAGVKRFFLPNIDSSTISPMLELCKQYPDQFFPMMGIHPSSIKENYKEELAIVEEWLTREKFCAIGETGIDLYWDKTFQKEQEFSLRQHVELAKKYQLPIVLHVRDSFDEVLGIIEEMNDETLKGIFHCFTGTIEQAQKIIGFGDFYLGIGGVVTFKNSGLDKVVKQIGREHLVLETDSPYLAPTPYRGKRNESSYIVKVAEKLAEIYEGPVEEIARVTTDNTKKLFGI